MIERDEVDFEALVADTRRAARLAHRGDVHRQDDIAQETLLVALRDASSQRRRSPAELRVIARRIALNLWRRDRARGERETIYVREGEPLETREPEAVEAPPLRDFLARIDAPSRSLLEQRYFDGLSLAEIAEREQVPVATVRTRHRRALARLRAVALSTDTRRTPERRAMGLAALVARVRSACSAALRPKALFAAALVASTATALVLFVDRDPRAEASSVRPTEIAAADDVAPTELTAPTARIAAATTGETSSSALGSAPMRTNELVVLNEAGQVVSGATIQRYGDRDSDEYEAVTTTDADGVARVADDGGWFGAEHEVHGASMLWRKGDDFEREDEPTHLRLTPFALRTSGRVVGPDGRAVENAHVVLANPGTPLAFLARSGDWRRVRPDRAALTDAAGRFQIRTVQRNATLIVSAPGLEARRNADAGGDLGDIRLEATDRTPFALAVESTGGDPIIGRSVWIERPPFANEPASTAARGMSMRHSCFVTDDSGTVELPADLAPTTRLKVVSADDPRRVALNVAVGELDGPLVVDEPLSPGATLSGRVAAGGIAFLDSAGLALPVEVQTDAEGRFALTGVPAGDFRLTGRSRTGHSLVTRSGTVMAGAHVDGLELVEMEPVVIELDVLSPPTRARRTVRIVRTDGWSKFRRSVAYDERRSEQFLHENGHGRLFVEEPGTYYLNYFDGQSVDTRRLEVTADGPDRIEVLLDPKAYPLQTIQFHGLDDSLHSNLIVRDEEGEIVWIHGRMRTVKLRSSSIPVLADRLELEFNCASGEVFRYTLTAEDVEAANGLPVDLYPR